MRRKQFVNEFSGRVLRASVGPITFAARHQARKYAISIWRKDRARLSQLTIEQWRELEPWREQDKGGRS
jgi:hypothetical protein